jgi:ketosteroid isomerase-like protein
MKRKLRYWVICISVCCMHGSADAQNNDETAIRVLEKREADAFAKKDTLTLMELFSPNLVVNAPINRVMAYAEVMALIREGKIDVGKVEKTIEKISIVDNIAIVMGKDLITAQGQMDHAGKIVTRRYTDIWMKQGDSWKLTARQATIVGIL